MSTLKAHCTKDYCGGVVLKHRALTAREALNELLSELTYSLHVCLR